MTRALELTEAAVFTGDENDAEVFINLTETRGELFGQIKILDDKISGDASGTETETLLNDIRRTAAALYALDEKNRAETARIMDGLRKSLRDLKDGKNVSIKYTDYIAVSDGMYFDQKN